MADQDLQVLSKGDGRGGGGGGGGGALERWTSLRETKYHGSSALRTSVLALTCASLRTSKFEAKLSDR